MRPVTDTEVELLLKRDARSRLPLARQILIYLDPFALFKDASSGPVRARESALTYNRAMRWMLLPYIRRWMAIAASLALLIAPASISAIIFATSRMLCPGLATRTSRVIASLTLIGGLLFLL